MIRVYEQFAVTQVSDGLLSASCRALPDTQPHSLPAISALVQHVFGRSPDFLLKVINQCLSGV
jgi:hypothetical protein